MDPLSRCCLNALLLFLISAAVCIGQDDSQPPAPEVPTAPDAATAPDASAADDQSEATGPATIDPVDLLPPSLTTRVTIKFDNEPLKDVAAWIQEQLSTPVLLDEAAIRDVGIPTGEPISDHLDDEPIYLLLNRLKRSLGLAWYLEEDVIYLTTAEIADEHQVTRPYDMTDFLDEEYDPIDITNTLQEAVGETWEDIDGIGGVMEWLGDVLFIRTTDRTHREVEALLQAIRHHGPRTLVYEPAQHQHLRELLEQPVDVEFDDTPLSFALESLAEKTGADIRLDEQALQDVGIRTREPVSLTLKNRNLRTVLVVLVKKFGLTWSLEDGVLWITTEEIADENFKTAVFDVRDLSRNADEAVELLDAIQDQSDGQWDDIDGIGGSALAPKYGILVIRQTERVINQVTDLLATYREALKNSKPRKTEEDDSNEVVTRFYRLDASIADDLFALIPQLVQPASWNAEDQTTPSPRILSASSGYELVDSHGAKLHDTNLKGQDAIVVPQSVLMIRHTLAAHQEITELINRIQHGDPMDAVGVPGLGGGGFGGGGGGFGGGLLGTGKGGGFFTLPPVRFSLPAFEAPLQVPE